MITEDKLFKYFRGDTTEAEENELNEWVQASPSNVSKFKYAFDVYEAVVMSGMADSTDKKTMRSPFVRKALWAVANVAAVIAMFLGAGYIADNSADRKLAKTMTSLTVPAGQRLDYTLPDGTLVKLNSGAKLSFPLAFAKDLREVLLSGEAYFDVTHNPQQPFVVRTFASDIKVLGTEFNVRADEKAGIFSTTLVEGSVMLSSLVHPGENMIMKPDDVVTLVDGHFMNESGADKSDICWIRGQVDISGNDFNAIVGRLENAYGVTIVIDRDTVPEFECANGYVRISDGIDHALKVLQYMADFTYSRDNRSDIIHIR